MPQPSYFRIDVRMCLAVVVAAAAMPLHATDADARRGVSAGIVGYKLMTRERNSGENSNAARSGSDAQPDDANPAAAPATPAANAAAKKPVEDVVPGCAPGMICTVCIAGCGSSNIVIVHAGRRLPRQE